VILLAAVQESANGPQRPRRRVTVATALRCTVAATARGPSRQLRPKADMSSRGAGLAQKTTRCNNCVEQAAYLDMAL
jgi:hypothetical protein